MTVYHDLPDPPGDWKITTNVSKHINYYNPEGDRTCIIITPDQETTSRRWDVSILCCDRWERGVQISKGEQLDEAVQTAHNAIRSLEEDEDSIEIIEYIKPDKNDQPSIETNTNQTKTTEESNTTSDSSEPEDGDETETQTGQASLEAFKERL